jgi:hypothetical protein
VAEQYAGTLGRTGVRGALLAAAAVAADPRHHGVLTGRGPAGARLEASRTFTTRTAAVCADRGCLAPGRAEELPGGIRTSLGVGASGRFSWHVGASTRPAVLAAGGREAWTVTCVARDGRRLGRVRVVVGRGQAVRVAPCGVPRR